MLSGLKEEKLYLVLHVLAVKDLKLQNIFSLHIKIARIKNIKYKWYRIRLKTFHSFLTICHLQLGVVKMSNCRKR